MREAKTNVPQGMNQQNRYNTGMIILRKYSDEERVLTIKMINTLVVTASIWFMISFFFILITLSIPLEALAYWIAKVIIIGIFGYHVYTLMKISPFRVVEHMLHSNDFQYASLNNEKVANLTNETNRQIGEIVSTTQLIKGVMITLSGCEFLIYIIAILVKYAS